MTRRRFPFMSLHTKIPVCDHSFPRKSPFFSPGGIMRLNVHALMAVLATLMLPLAVSTQEGHQDKVQYVPRYRDPVLKEMEQKNAEAKKEKEAETQSIRDAQTEAKEKEPEREMRLDFSAIEKPTSPEAFKPPFHFAPSRQYLTGTCWCFSTTSFFESEVCRLSGRKIKLSEMYTVYYEYLEKARRYIRERGDSFFQEGSQGNAVIMIWRQYGIVPAEAYKGELDPDGRYDHSEMVAEMQTYLQHVKDHDLWDEELVLASLRLVMDKYMGRPPEHFIYDGTDMTPRQFLSDILKLNLDEYVCLMSTLSQPFHEYGEYEVEGNWWHSHDYLNVPLDQFYRTIRSAAQAGYTVRLNGDVSEPGYYGLEGVAIVPTFDIPYRYINQDSREFRFHNKTSTDDHDIHLIGFTRVGKFDWFLIKDSAASAQRGPFKGYYFYREDYIKLKMLTCIVHMDMAPAAGD